jgi:hypothetical protein
MRLQWRGRSYKPAGNYIKVYKPDVNELIKPLSQKGKLGSAILTGSFISGIGDNYAPEPTSPVVTPSVTPTNTITPTPSLTPSLTPSETPPLVPADCVWDTNTLLWSANTNNWEDCQDVPQPSPTPTETTTSTPTPSVTPTNTTTPTNTNTPTPSITPSSTPPAFDPSSLGNLQYWFDASSGFTVSSWSNQGLLGGADTQGTATRQPQLVSSTFGTWTGNTVQFLGANREFMTGSFTSTNFSAFTHFIVGSIDGGNTATANIAYDMFSGASVNNRVWFKAGNNTTQARVITGNRIYNITRPANGIYLIELSGTNVTNGVDVYSNDTLISSAATATTSANTVTVFNFSYDPGSTYSMDMRIAEVLVYNRVLNPTEFQQVEDYLKTKYQYNSW